MKDSAAAWSGVSAVSLNEHLWGCGPRPSGSLRGWKSPPDQVILSIRRTGGGRVGALSVSPGQPAAEWTSLLTELLGS